jgi:hypothetical protein
MPTFYHFEVAFCTVSARMRAMNGEPTASIGVELLTGEMRRKAPAGQQFDASEPLQYSVSAPARDRHEV